MMISLYHAKSFYMMGGTSRMVSSFSSFCSLHNNGQYSDQEEVNKNLLPFHNNIDRSVNVPHGLCAIYKPRGFTSSDVVQKIRGILEKELRKHHLNNMKMTRKQKKMAMKVKVGHGGTLDPLASGVLILGIGDGCKSLESYLAGSKSYRSIGLLGVGTNTLDSDGDVVEEKSYTHISTLDYINNILPKFTGNISQKPPMFSALKVKGERLYNLGRQGIEVERKSRPIFISDLRILKNENEWSSSLPELAQNIRSYEREIEEHSRPPLPNRFSFLQNNIEALGEEDKVINEMNDSMNKGTTNTQENSTLPFFALSLSCGGGTYVRSLIADIGESLNSVAHMVWLERTQQGPYCLGHCLPQHLWNFENICKHTIACSDLAKRRLE